jgi:uncharacterized protein YegP (UPF0339 family)
MPAKFVISRTQDGKYCFDLIAMNGEKVLHSGNYPTKISCLEIVKMVRVNASFLHRYEKKTNASGQHFFILRSDGEKLGTSDLYWSSNSRDYAMMIIKREAPDAVTIE